MQNPSSRGRIGAAFVIGVLVGILACVAAYVGLHRDTVVYEARDTVLAEGIRIPKGTKLIHDTLMSEGFDRTILYINIGPKELQEHFTRTVDDRALLVIPYWVDSQ